MSDANVRVGVVLLVVALCGGTFVAEAAAAGPPLAPTTPPARTEAPQIWVHHPPRELTDAPTEVATRKVRTNWRSPAIEVGTVQPIWITVQTPADLPPQVYRGKITIQADGLAATDVPIIIKVHGFFPWCWLWHAPRGRGTSR